MWSSGRASQGAWTGESGSAASSGRQRRMKRPPASKDRSFKRRTGQVVQTHLFRGDGATIGWPGVSVEAPNAVFVADGRRPISDGRGGGRASQDSRRPPAMRPGYTLIDAKLLEATKCMLPLLRTVDLTVAEDDSLLVSGMIWKGFPMPVEPRVFTTLF